jgi:hypothetical protein
VDHPLAKALLRQLIEPFHGSKVLGEARMLEFRIGAAQVVAVERAVRPHAPGEETAAQGAVAEGRNVVLSAIVQDTLLNAAFKQIERRLQDVQGRNSLEMLHLCDREVAHADCANLALLEEGAHGLGGLRQRLVFAGNASRVGFRVARRPELSDTDEGNEKLR